jgi:hypothetical protein
MRRGHRHVIMATRPRSCRVVSAFGYGSGDGEQHGFLGARREVDQGLDSRWTIFGRGGSVRSMEDWDGEIGELRDIGGSGLLMLLGLV